MRNNYFRVHSNDCRFNMQKTFTEYRIQNYRHKGKLKLVFDYKNVIAKNNKTIEHLKEDQFAYIFCKE